MHRVLTVTLVLWFNRVKYRHAQLEEKLEERRKEEEKKRQEEEEKERRLEALRVQVRHTLMSAACRNLSFFFYTFLPLFLFVCVCVCVCVCV